MSSRAVDYATAIVAELPEATPSAGPSPLEDQLQEIIDNSEYHAPLWARIAKYSSAEHVAAAGAAANILRRRHGDDESVEGWRFETRRVDNGMASGLFAQFSPNAIMPGKADENKIVYEAWRQRQAEAAKVRATRRAERQTQALLTAQENGELDEELESLAE
jgi:hypothetical protein